MDFGRYLVIALTIVAFMFGLWILLQVLGVVTSGLNTATNQVVESVASVTPSIYGMQPTTTPGSTTGYLAQLPVGSVTSNPYGGATGQQGLLSAVAITYGGVSAVVWFYQPGGAYGGLLGFTCGGQYPANLSGCNTAWLYVGTDGRVYASDWGGVTGEVNTQSPLPAGWHMAVVEEYYSGGAYYITLYVDGQYIGTASMPQLTQLFGTANFVYDDVGSAYALHFTATNNYWFFYSGSVAYVAVYNTVLSQSQVQQLYSAGFPNTLFAQNLVAAYYLSPTYYNGGGYYLTPYYTNPAILNQLNISNATAISITPSGSVGAIPSSQFVPFKGIVAGGTIYTINNATGMDANKIFSPAVNYAQYFASVFAIVLIIGLVVGFIWTRRR